MTTLTRDDAFHLLTSVQLQINMVKKLQPATWPECRESFVQAAAGIGSPAAIPVDRDEYLDLLETLARRLHHHASI